MNEERLTLLIAYAVGRARRFGLSSLGVTQLVKLVYLADLAFAGQHGDTLTGVSWRFHHFGPWSERVAESIDQAATRWSLVPVEYERADDGSLSTRWTRSEALRLEDERALPATVRQTIDRHLAANADLPALLRHVYDTPPMRRAKPGETLVFERRLPPSEPDEPRIIKQKKLAQMRQSLRERARPRSGRSPVAHDQALAEAIGALLDADDRESLAAVDGELHFPPEFWDSGWRDDEED